MTEGPVQGHGSPQHRRTGIAQHCFLQRYNFTAKPVAEPKSRNRYILNRMATNWKAVYDKGLNALVAVADLIWWWPARLALRRDVMHPAIVSV